ncbi:hypothetical protein [Vibrio sp. Hal054]|uniref:hypothetical protein n=1 Tax=Vibrio sp. Hal054 TaxID=3035158 RepID=UPI00301DBD6B
MTKKRPPRTAKKKAVQVKEEGVFINGVTVLARRKSRSAVLRKVELSLERSRIDGLYTNELEIRRTIRNNLNQMGLDGIYTVQSWRDCV